LPQYSQIDILVITYVLEQPIKQNIYMGDGMAVATRTDVGSIPATGGIFLRAVTVSRERGRLGAPSITPMVLQLCCTYTQRSSRASHSRTIIILYLPTSYVFHNKHLRIILIIVRLSFNLHLLTTKHDILIYDINTKLTIRDL